MAEWIERLASNPGSCGSDLHMDISFFNHIPLLLESLCFPKYCKFEPSLCLTGDPYIPIRPLCNNPNRLTIQLADSPGR